MFATGGGRDYTGFGRRDWRRRAVRVFRFQAGLGETGRGALFGRGPTASYSVVVAHKVGVICRSCGERIEIEDEYIRGVRAADMAAALYKPIGKSPPDFVTVAWQETLTCGNGDSDETEQHSGGKPNTIPGQR